jgi:hypothetical protein
MKPAGAHDGQGEIDHSGLATIRHVWAFATGRGVPLGARRWRGWAAVRDPSKPVVFWGRTADPAAS